MSILVSVSFQAAAARHSQDFVSQSSLAMSDALGRLPDLLMGQLTGLLAEGQISLAAKSENPRNVALGRLLGGIVLEKKQGTGLKTEEGLPVSRCVGRGRDIPELHLRTHMKQGSWGLQTPSSNHANSRLSFLEGLSVWFVGHLSSHAQNQADFPCILRHKDPAFPRGNVFPLPKPGLACSPSMQEGQLARHP